MERWIVGLVVVLAACSAQAGGRPVSSAPKPESGAVTLSAEVATPAVLAGQKQSVFLKIGLEGLAPAERKRAPVNLALVIDQSSSMSGDKIAAAREAAILAVRHLSPEDIVSVVAYDDVVTIVSPATKVSEPEAIIAAIERIEARGSTALFAGVVKGAEELRKFIDKNRVNRVILLSDGQANVGPSSPGELAALGASLAKEGVTVTTIGLGLGYNEDLMAQLARAADGNHAFVEQASELAKVFKLEFGDVLSVVAQDVELEIRCRPGARPLRVLGRDATITGNLVRTTLNQLYARQEKYVLLEVEVDALTAAETRQLAEVSLRYVDLGRKVPGAASGAVSVEGVTSTSAVDKQTNQEVMVAVVEMEASERNKQALAMRDAGAIADAKKLLEGNAAYLEREAKRYRSPKLKKLEERNRDNAMNLDDDDWNKTRKEMRKMQNEVEMQQAY